MDPTKLLKKQHRQVEALFKELDKTEEAEERRELMEELVMNLELHMRIEEEMFYPAVREVDTKKAEEMVLEAYEEHAVAKLVMGQIPQVDPEDERFKAKMTVFKELIKHHVEEEESEMFKLAAKLDDEELEELGERMNAEVEAQMGSDAAEKGRKRRAA